MNGNNVFVISEAAIIADPDCDIQSVQCDCNCNDSDCSCGDY